MLGWEVRSSTAAFALLGASGRLGLSGELLFEPRQHTLLFATFVHLENHLARAAAFPVYAAKPESARGIPHHIDSCLIVNIKGGCHGKVNG